MTVELWPADGVHLAVIDDDIIVLDVQADAYSCLHRGAQVIRLAPDGSITAADEGCADELVAAGLARPGPPAQIRRRPTPALRDRQWVPDPHKARVASVGVDLLASTLRFRRRSFQDLIKTAARRPDPARARNPACLDAILSAYRAALPWIPFEGECLQRAFLLQRLLMRRGIAADWVFGVRTWPFAAHCWVQIADEVIGDTLARTRLYTPIMVV
jgi:hypothetical protein